MVALQVASAALMLTETNALAVVCFLGATAGVLAAQALNN